VRVALDTNVLISAVAARGLCADLFNLILAEHDLIVGETVLSELRRVLSQKIRVPGKTIDEFVALLRQEALVVKKGELVAVEIRDKDDLPVLSEAIAGNADVLVTGDADLLTLTEKLPLRVLSPRGFWEELRDDTAIT
jgi:uncharacterized protein